MPETLYLACTGKAGHPSTLTGAVNEFLTYKNLTFQCDQLPADTSGGRIGTFSQAHLYLVWIVSWLWRTLSVSYSSLKPLVIVLYLTYLLGCYAVMRLFFSSRASAIGTGLILASPTTITMLPYLRDFSKAPFIVWTFFFLVAISRSKKMKSAIVLSALCGCTAGLGYGFRSDAAVLIYLLPLLIILGNPALCMLKRCTIVIVGIACFVACTLPLGTTSKFGAMGAMAMEGASDPFNKFLGFDEPAYSWGARYSDELTLSSIAADLRPLATDWDNQESAPAFGISQAISGSTGFFLSRLDLFIGDLATKSLKASALLLAYPSLITTERLSVDPGQIPISKSTPFVFQTVYDFIGYFWFVPLGLLAFTCLSFLRYKDSPKEALLISILILLLTGMTSTQFSMRHFFHLEFIWILGALSVYHCVRNTAELRTRGLQFLLLLAAVLALATVSLTAARMIQDNAISTAIDKLLSDPKEDVASAISNHAGQTTFTIPVPPIHEALIQSSSDSMVGKDLPISVQWDVRAAADRLLIRFGGENCKSSPIDININYKKRNAWQPFDQSLSISRHPSLMEEPTIVVLPAFYRPTQFLESISLPDKVAGCLLSIERIKSRSRLPSVFSAVLQPNWRDKAFNIE